MVAHRWIPFAALFVLLGWSRAEAQTITRLDGSRLPVTEAAEFARRTLTENGVTGAEIAVLNGGKLVWSAGFGERHKDPSLPMTPDTNTWAASLTKSVFATYVMGLVEREGFDLDQPLAAQLPRPLDTYESFHETASELVKDPRWAGVTPRMALSHTTGLANLAMFEPDKKLHLHFDPGARYSYSGDGLNVLQFVIEQRKGKPLDELVQDAIFEPLHMTQTGMIYRKEFAENVSDRFRADGAFQAQTRRFPARAAGNMSTSANDLAHFLEALFAGRLLKPETMRRMWSPQIRIRTPHQFPMRGDEARNGDEAEAVGLAYGLGWGLLTRTKFGPAFFKEGHGDGAQNYMVCFIKSRSCMVLLTNSENGELAFRELFEHILGDTVTPWEWEMYTRSAIMANRSSQ